MRRFKGECAHFCINKSPIYTHDGATVQEPNLALTRMKRITVLVFIRYLPDVNEVQTSEIAAKSLCWVKITINYSWALLSMSIISQ
jgi:hypothetical protein